MSAVHDPGGARRRTWVDSQRRGTLRGFAEFGGAGGLGVGGGAAARRAGGGRGEANCGGRAHLGMRSHSSRASLKRQVVAMAKTLTCAAMLLEGDSRRTAIGQGGRQVYGEMGGRRLGKRRKGKEKRGAAGGNLVPSPAQHPETMPALLIGARFRCFLCSSSPPAFQGAAISIRSIIGQGFMLLLIRL